MKSKIMFTSLLATALIVPGHASAECTINSARIQQVSEREILAVIDGYCTRENGESGYYTQIAPDTYGEVMAVYGNRNIDQYGRGFESRYGFNIVFSDSKDSYEAGVWIGDADGVVHSEVMTIANEFATTTTSSSSTTTIPLSPSTTLPPVVQTVQAPTESPQIQEATTTTATTVLSTTTTTSSVLQVVKKAQITKKTVLKKKSKRVFRR